MVSIVFRQAGQELLKLQVNYGQPVASSGDTSWLDFAFEPYSPRLGRPISWQEDCEEWTRSLAEGYQGSGLEVETLIDTGPPTPAAAPQSFAPAATSTSPPTASSEQFNTGFAQQFSVSNDPNQLDDPFIKAEAARNRTFFKRIFIAIPSKLLVGNLLLVVIVILIAVALSGHGQHYQLERIVFIIGSLLLLVYPAISGWKTAQNYARSGPLWAIISFFYAHIVSFIIAAAITTGAIVAFGYSLTDFHVSTFSFTSAKPPLMLAYSPVPVNPSIQTKHLGEPDFIQLGTASQRYTTSTQPLVNHCGTVLASIDATTYANCLKSHQPLVATALQQQLVIEQDLHQDTGDVAPGQCRSALVVLDQAEANGYNALLMINFDADTNRIKAITTLQKSLKNAMTDLTTHASTPTSATSNSPKFSACAPAAS